jgi:hypothetical protein
MMRWPMTSSDAERPVADVAFLDSDMSVRDLCAVLEYLPWRRDAHQIVIDAGVRHYLLGVLKERLPRFSAKRCGVIL